MLPGWRLLKMESQSGKGSILLLKLRQEKSTVRVPSSRRMLFYWGDDAQNWKSYLKQPCVNAGQWKQWDPWFGRTESHETDICKFCPECSKEWEKERRSQIKQTNKQTKWSGDRWGKSSKTFRDRSSVWICPPAPCRFCAPPSPSFQPLPDVVSYASLGQPLRGHRFPPLETPVPSSPWFPETCAQHKSTFLVSVRSAQVYFPGQLCFVEGTRSHLLPSAWLNAQHGRSCQGNYFPCRSSLLLIALVIIKPLFHPFAHNLSNKLYQCSQRWLVNLLK